MYFNIASKNSQKENIPSNEYYRNRPTTAQNLKIKKELEDILGINLDVNSSNRNAQNYQK